MLFYNKEINDTGISCVCLVFISCYHSFSGFQQFAQNYD